MLLDYMCQTHLQQSGAGAQFYMLDCQFSCRKDLMHVTGDMSTLMQICNLGRALSSSTPASLNNLEAICIHLRGLWRFGCRPRAIGSSIQADAILCLLVIIHFITTIGPTHAVIVHVLLIIGAACHLLLHLQE